MRTAAVLLALLSACVLAPGAGAARGDRARAAGAYAAIAADFQVAPGLYRDDASAPSGTYAAAWPLSQALAAALALAAAPGGAAYGGEVTTLLVALGRYWDGTAYESQIRPPFGTGGDVYNDDNEWIALDLLDANALAPRRWLVVRAERLFDLVSAAWSRDATLACPGGVRWSAGSDDRNAVSTENAALVAVRLYALTHAPSYLHWARTMDGWVERCLRGPDGLVRDGIGADGSVDGETWSYNQGAAIAVSADLWRATRSTAYLVRAQQTAQAALAAGFASDPPAFVAIFFRDLSVLQPVPAAMRAYADGAWTQLQLGDGQLLDHAALADLYGRLAALGA